MRQTTLIGCSARQDPTRRDRTRRGFTDGGRTYGGCEYGGCAYGERRGDHGLPGRLARRARRLASAIAVLWLAAACIEWIVAALLCATPTSAGSGAWSLALPDLLAAGQVAAAEPQSPSADEADRDIDDGRDVDDDRDVDDEHEVGDGHDEQIPPPLTEYYGRRIAPTMSYLGANWLTRESRAREESSELLLEALGLEPGQVVCDLGCGNGYYTFDLARRVGPTGRVLAVDIQPEMLRLLEQRAREAEIDHIETILGSPIDPHLPAGQVDLVLLVDVYHEFSHPEQMLRAIRRSLKPQGRAVLVEFRAEDPFVPIKPLHKMSRAQVLKEMEPNGFRLVDQFDKLPWQHVLFFEPSPPGPAPEGADQPSAP